MADCTSLLDEELSSFVFNYLTENTGSQFGEKEACTDRLDADFPEIDFFRLDSSDFDSANCLSELQWCNDQSAASSASSQFSVGDSELFETEEENAALLAALTDSLDGMVVDEVGGLSVFPSLGEVAEGQEEEEEEEDPNLEESHPFPAPPSPETEDLSLLKKLLLSPANVPVNYETHKQGSIHRHSNGIHKSKSQRPSVKCLNGLDRKPRGFLPPSRKCSELHRHLTCAPETEDSEEESGSEEDSSSEAEAPTPPAPPQYSSPEELRSVVDLIRYMHTYCLPVRKHPSVDRRERECPGSVRRARPDCPLPSVKAAPQTDSCERTRGMFVRKREVKGHSLLRELLESASCYDVSKPYRIRSPPYIASCSPKGTLPWPPVTKEQDRKVKPEPVNAVPRATEKETTPDCTPEPAASAPGRKVEGASFSVRRSRRLASCPGRFAKKPRGGGAWRVKAEPMPGVGEGKEAGSTKPRPAERPGQSTCCKKELEKSAAINSSAAQNEKRARLTLPLAPKPQGDNKPFEQTLRVELCGTAGLTPPTTPPHKPLEEDLFKPEVKGESPPKGSCLPAGGGGRPASRKTPEQTELYAQLRKEGKEGEVASQGGRRTVQRTFGDHDYCLQSAPGERHKKSSPPVCQEEEEHAVSARLRRHFGPPRDERLFSKVPEYLRWPDSEGEGSPRSRSRSPLALAPHNSRESPERSSRPPTPGRPASCTPCCRSRSPSGSQSFSCENSETCHKEKQRNKSSDDCRVLCIHHLPNRVTQPMLRRRFESFGELEDCRIVMKNNERCGIITYKQTGSTPPGWTNEQAPRKRREPAPQITSGGLRRFCRKPYIDLDDGGLGPVKSKYDAVDFDTLLKEAQKSLHR
ncbi:peroxisome proliferator-activated receptor gamma coactivator 1-beta [Acipenser oxyrinchus oxyrinchus]|uniref:Peroxisome proliferator-activated receptor gamma coactivator 1-beta n=1 Tax=Acipenser oxyrinchus oxyrinchus TaxID=40147 RepID=A0AAD8D180_ACIOX|nr:peroxisome proliferator-activated receptor gamma coactivator 1-beta [Acipenser oxyrinchus oxyrinchus]